VSDLYTLTSHHKTPVELLVLESSPVSTNDQIQGRGEVRSETHRGKLGKRQGVVAWSRSIAPNQTLKFSVAYAISFPKDGAVARIAVICRPRKFDTMTSRVGPPNKGGHDVCDTYSAPLRSCCCSSFPSQLAQQ